MTGIIPQVSLATAFVHEIKNPAALALAHISLAREQLEELNEIDVHLSHIENALTDISFLAQEMLFVHQVNLPSSEIDVNLLLEEVLQEYQSAWPSIGFTLNKCTNATAHGQEQFLRMIISNLLKNAVEAVTGGKYPGHIIIISEYENEQLKISICDNGTSQTIKPYSSGLGVNICHSLAAKLNASVNINIGVNGGCVAEILF